MSSTCSVCGRALRRRASQLAGVGPRCARRLYFAANPTQLVLPIPLPPPWEELELPWSEVPATSPRAVQDVHTTLL